MAQVIVPGQVRTNDGKTVAAQNGGWYDGQQYWDGTLSQAGVINSKSNQVGAGQAVSAEVNRQTSIAAGKDPNANQNYINQQNGGMPVPGGGGGAGGGMGMGAGMAQPEVLNLPKLYEQLYANSGIADIEKDLSAKEKAKIEAEGQINDNPWLGEATRVGRVAKLNDLYEKRTASIRNDIAVKKADIETKLNLETKQFDINSQAAQQALSKFNTLLSMGALDNASGEDIANIMRSTGLSSAAIMSAVQSARDKNRNTQVITSTNDAGVVTATVIDQNTGEIIKSTSLGNIGNAQTGSSKANESEQKSYYQDKLREQAQSGLTLSQIFGLFTGYLPPDEIYQLYNANSKYGPDKGSVENLKQYGVTQEE